MGIGFKGDVNVSNYSFKIQIEKTVALPSE